MSSLFKESTIEKIKAIKKGFLWTAVCILIGEVVLGAILILVGSFNETIGKLMGTFALCAIMMFFGVNNFSRMEKGDRIIQSFALVSLICNVIWLLLSFMFIWEVVPYMEYSGKYYSYHMTIPAKMFSVAVNIAIMSFLISNVWSIEESLKPVRPLKITAIICALYCGIYAAVMTVGDVQLVDDVRWNALAGLAGLAFVLMTCAALIVSNSGTKKNEKTVNNAGNVNSTEMEAKIQEMVEKEVQERLKAEREKAEWDAMPPLQADDMPPSVNHDNNVKTERLGDLGGSDDSNGSNSEPGTSE